MKIEEQIENLSQFGIALNDGITIDDLLYTAPREEYEKKPFDLLMFMLGAEVEREPWGRRFCNSVWNFDTECIYQTGEYSKIVRNLFLLAGKENKLTDVKDYFSMEENEAWVEYNGTKVNIIVEEDWADVIALTDIMEDISDQTGSFYFIDNGQAMILLFLSSENADKFIQLTGIKIKPVSEAFLD
ncbi:MAG: hypothetical protein OEZ34_04895 [Spirochaetia bacterium]|nr:hypothetical protein [Spirochaetia bacterium]